MFVYILYSSSLGCYYTGQTQDVDERIIRHNSGRVNSTKSGCPWSIVKVIDVTSRSEAVIIERKIKKRGSKRFLEED